MKKLIVILVLGVFATASAVDVLRKDVNVNGIATATTAWTNGFAPTSSDIAVWNSTIGSGTAANNLGTSTSWLGIRVGSALSRAVVLNAAGTELLTLGSSGIDMTSAALDFTIGTKVDLGASQTWAVKTARTLAVRGDISGASGSVLTKNDLGTLTLGGANTYSGGTVLNAGTLNITNSGGLGSGTLTINGGALNNGANAVTTNSNAMVINNDFIGVRNLNLGGNGISLGTAAGSSRTITVATNGNVISLRGAIVNGTTANQLIKSGDGGLQLLGTNTYTGGTVLNGGSLYVNNSASLGSGILTINGGTIDAKSNQGATGGVSLVNAGMVINSDFAVNSLVGGSSYTIDFGRGDVSLGSAGSSRTISQKGSSAITIGGNISDGTGGSKQLIINATGGGKLSLTGTNSYSGGTLINAGSGVVALGGPNTSSGGVILSDGASLEINHAEALSKGTFTINGGLINNLSGANVTNANSGAIVINNDFGFTGSRSLDLGVGSVSLGTSNGTSRTISLTNFYQSLKFGGVVSDGTTAKQLIKAGDGELKLSGANTYSGGTLLNRGQITTSNEYALGTGGLRIANDSANLTGRLNLEKSLTLQGELSSGASSSTNFTGINLGAAANTLTLNQSGNSEYGQGIMGSGKLDKSGVGTLTLSGSNSYVGATTVSGGKLIVNSLYNKSKITVQNGGTLGGTGSLKAVTLDAGAILAAGNSPGTMNFDGTVILSAGSTNIMEIFTSEFDVLRDSAGTNKLTLAGMNIFDFAGNTVTNGATFAVFQNWGSISNSGAIFTGVNMGAGQSVTVDTGTGVLTVIPEPAVIGLLGLGAIITLLVRRRPR